MSKLLLTIILGVFLGTSTINAQTEQSVADTLQLDDIIVTGTKLPVSLKETIRPVTIITRNQIEQSSSTDLSHILHNQSGIRVNNSQSSPGENRSLSIQGAGGEYTLILIDGVAVSDPSGVGGAIDLRLLSLNNIERIEVLKGNQSALYGSDAVAGVINIITRKQAESSIKPTGTIEYGAYNSFRGSASVSGSIRDMAAYSIGYNRESSDGISAARSPDASTTFGKDGFSRDSFYGNVSLFPVSSLEIRPFITYSSFDGDFDAGSFLDASNTFSIEMINPGVQTNYSSGNVRAQATYQFTKTDRLFTTGFGENVFEGEFQNLDTFLSFQFNESVNILGGLNLQDATIPGDSESGISESNASFLSPYATLLISTETGFETEAGFRINNHSEFGANTTFNVAPGYRISDSMKIFASAGSAFRAPTLSQLFGQFGANPDLEPETSTNYQGGVEAFFNDRRTKVELIYFRRKIENLIAFGADGFVNRDQENVSGIELSVNWIISGNLTLGTFYNYLDGETVTLDGSGSVLFEDDLLRKPKHNFGLNASYRFNNRLQLKADAEYSSDRKDLFFNPENNFSSEEVTLDSYFLANVYAEYGAFNNQFVLFTTVRNIFDSDFSEVYGFNTLGVHARAGVRFSL